MNTQECGRCGKSRPIGRFEIIKPSGNRRRVCRDCQNEQAKMRRRRIKEDRIARGKLPAPVPEGKWKCAKCECVLDLDKFYPRSTHSRGVRSRCKECERADAAIVRRAERRARQKKSGEPPKIQSPYTKQCPDCKRNLFWTWFYNDRNSNHPRKIATYCIECKRRQVATARIERWYAAKAVQANTAAGRVGLSEKLRADDVLARWNMYGGKCAYCGELATQIDHVIPLRPLYRDSPGPNVPANIRPCCKQCNHSKSNSELASWIARYNPRERARLPKYRLVLVEGDNAEVLFTHRQLDQTKRAGRKFVSDTGIPEGATLMIVRGNWAIVCSDKFATLQWHDAGRDCSHARAVAWKARWLRVGETA